MYTELVDALGEFKRDGSISVVVLTGSGPYFTSGADLADPSKYLGEDLRTGAVSRFMYALINFPKPIIAAVNGPAVGIGVTLLPHCDIVYAVNDSDFWTPFMRIAVVPEFCSSVTFREILGRSTANAMLLEGRKIDAQTARDRGLVTDVFPREGFLERVLERAGEMVTFPLAEKSLGLYKRMITRHTRQRMIDVCALELEELEQRRTCGDISDAVQALLQKRAQSKL